MYYYIWKAADGFRWYLKAANNKKIAESGEAYHNKADCQAGIDLVKGSANVTVLDLTLVKT